ncbi:hypothetical protein CLAIMM_04102 [Cladophialophora immunda]|nr:hypothetical protein CLAIMM_04102 [Cladophialophora immunda]
MVARCGYIRMHLYASEVDGCVLVCTWSSQRETHPHLTVGLSIRYLGVQSSVGRYPARRSLLLRAPAPAAPSA